MKKILKNIIYSFLRKIYNFRPEIYLNISKLIQDTAPSESTEKINSTTVQDKAEKLLR